MKISLMAITFFVFSSTSHAKTETVRNAPVELEQILLGEMQKMDTQQLDQINDFLVGLQELLQESVDETKKSKKLAHKTVGPKTKSKKSKTKN